MGKSQHKQKQICKSKVLYNAIDKDVREYKNMNEQNCQPIHDILQC